MSTVSTVLLPTAARRQQQEESIQFLSLAIDVDKTMSRDDEFPTRERGDECSALEAIEQQLIQHLRTAGIRKPREIELINEVMELRRERRRSFRNISMTAQKYIEENQHLRAQLSSSIKETESEVSSRKGLLARALQSKDSEIHSAIQHYDAKYLKEKERNVSLMKLQIDNISKTYEDKLKKVDQKIQELLAAKDGHDQRAAETIAFDMTSNAISELNDRHKLKLQKYKETLRSVADRERELGDELLKTQGKLRYAEDEKTGLATRLREAESHFTHMKEKERDMKRSILSLKSTLEESLANAAKVECDLKYVRRESDSQLAEINRRHTEELLLIDNKVRKTLQVRDETIHLLRDKVVQAEMRQNEVEKILGELNAGFSSSPMRSTSKHPR